MYGAIFGGYYHLAYNSSNGASHVAVLGGREAVVDKYGHEAFSAGRHSYRGDCQKSILVGRAETLDATPTTMFLDGSPRRIIIRMHSGWAFSVYVIAAEQGMANIKVFERTGIIVSDNGVIRISTVDTVGVDRTIGAPGAWSVAITPDNTNDAMNIEVTGEAATSIRWVARIELTESANPG